MPVQPFSMQHTDGQWLLDPAARRHATITRAVVAALAVAVVAGLLFSL